MRYRRPDSVSVTEILVNSGFIQKDSLGDTEAVVLSSHWHCRWDTLLMPHSGTVLHFDRRDGERQYKLNSPVLKVWRLRGTWGSERSLKERGDFERVVRKAHWILGFLSGVTEYKNWESMLNLYKALINCGCFRLAPRPGIHTLESLWGSLGGWKGDLRLWIQRWGMLATRFGCIIRIFSVCSKRDWVML